MTTSSDPSIRTNDLHTGRAAADGGFITAAILSERWNMTEQTLGRMRSDGSGPAFHRIGGRILYKLADIEAFEASTRSTKTKPGE